MSDLSIAKAAKLCGKSESTVRRWASLKMIPGRKNADGRWTFQEDELSSYMSAHGGDLIDSGKVMSNRGRPAKASSSDSQSARVIAALEDSLKRERSLSDDVREQLQAAQAEIVRLTQEIKALLSKDKTSSPARWVMTKVQEAFTRQ